MIERYTRPQMGRIWSQQNRLQKWLQVEVAVAEAWAEVGRVPWSAVEEMRRATVDVERWRHYEAQMHHDLNAFLRAVADALSPEAASYLHLGLTSYDVEDTALALLLSEAAQLLDEDLAALMDAVREKALEHRQTIMAGRTHGVHAEPTSFGLKLALWWDELSRHRQRLAPGPRPPGGGRGQDGRAGGHPRQRPARGGGERLPQAGAGGGAGGGPGGVP